MLRRAVELGLTCPGLEHLLQALVSLVVVGVSVVHVNLDLLVIPKFVMGAIATQAILAQDEKERYERAPIPTGLGSNNFVQPSSPRSGLSHGRHLLSPFLCNSRGLILRLRLSRPIPVFFCVFAFVRTGLWWVVLWLGSHLFCCNKVPDCLLR